MNVKLRIFLVLAMLVYTGCIYYFLKHKRFQLKYSLIWIFGGCVIWFCVAFPKLFNIAMHKLGVAEAMNGVFGICTFFILILLMSMTAVLSFMDTREKQLIQKVALLEKQVRELEDRLEKEVHDE